LPAYQLIQLDVFTTQPLCGNPLAVFPEAEGLSDKQMLQIAREMNLSETVFVLRPRETPEPQDGPEVLRRLRIFTPVREIPFAGHPIVGTWNALAREGVVAPPAGGTGWVRIHHEIGIGVLPVDIEFNDGQVVQVMMTQGKPELAQQIEDVQDQAELCRALGLEREDLDDSLPIQIVSTGLPFLVVPARSLEIVGHLRVKMDLLAEAYRRCGGTGCYVFTRETKEGGQARAHARMFAPDDNVPEDPATGSAAGALGAYLVHHGAARVEAVSGTSSFVIEQGDFINRRSRIGVEVRGAAGAVEQVRVGGPSVVVLRGELLVAGDATT
jgi:trans-2,3-dihydro-3-hydroxyanthranilate isomerase